jgi:hypothetical protein
MAFSAGGTTLNASPHASGSARPVVGRSPPPEASSPQEHAMAASKNPHSTHKRAAKSARHAPRDESGQSGAEQAEPPAHNLKAVAITIDADSAEIVSIEGLDATGARHELSDEEKASLIKESQGAERLEAVVEDAFEAGIACVLGDEAEEETAQESPADAELRHLLIAPLIERSTARHLTEPAALNRAILGTLLEHSMK